MHRAATAITATRFTSDYPNDNPRRHYYSSTNNMGDNDDKNDDENDRWDPDRTVVFLENK